MPAIRIDDEVYRAIWQRGMELGLAFPSPNDVLRTDYVDGNRSTPNPAPPTKGQPVPNQSSSSSESSYGSSIQIPLNTIHYARTYHLFPIPKKYRRFFPGYKVDFELDTDLGVLTTRVTSAPDGTLDGDPEGGAYIQKNLRNWYNAHKELTDGARLQIDALDPGKRYRLSVISSGQQ